MGISNISSHYSQENLNTSFEQHQQRVSSSEEVDHPVEYTQQHVQEMNVLNTVSVREQEKIRQYLQDQLAEHQEQDYVLRVCEKNIQLWKEYFYALQGDQDKIDKTLREYSYTYIDYGSITTPYFLWLDNLSDEKLEQEYVKNFTSLDSQYHLGKIMMILDSKAFILGFTSAMKGENPQINDQFAKIIHIVQRLVNISKKSNSL